MPEMKKMPRKFSEGGTAPAPVQTKPAEAKKKPADNMPDWAKKAREEQKADMATDKGYKAATAKDSLAPKGFKKGGSIKKFAEGGKFSSDVYERARHQIKDRFSNSQEEATTGLDELIKTSPKEKPEAPKAAPKKSESAVKSGKGGGAGATEPDVPYGRRDAPTLGDRRATRTEPKESPKVKDNESDSDLSVEPRRYLPRGRNYSATGEMSPQGAELVKEAGITAATLTPFGVIPRALQAASAPFKLSRKLHEAKAAKRAEEAAARARAPKDLDEATMAGEGGRWFKSGGKVAKYAKGGGVESKGKTKGTVVKMAKGGSVKGWGIARGSKACKMV